MVSYNIFSAEMIIERDPGELSLTDFISLNFEIKIEGIVKNIVFGDYSLNAGQGLILSSAYGLMKSSQAILPAVSGKALISPYHSTHESYFFRGAAIHLNLSNFSLLMFYSNKKFDAVIDSSGNIISAPADGYHRTELEISRADNALEISLGGGLMYSNENILNIRMFHYSASFNKPRTIGLRSSKLYNFTSFSYDLNLVGVFFSGETAFDGDSFASLNHLSIPVSKEIKIITSFRWYPNFIALHGNPFAERNNILRNETGFYSGISYRSSIGYLNIYFDQYQLKGSFFPLKGNEWLFNYMVDMKDAEINFIYRCSNREDTNSNNETLKETKQNYSIVLDYKINKYLRSKSRIHFKNVTPLKSEGYMFYQDFHYMISGFQIYSRLIFFKTGSFSSAVYEYENNLPGVFQNTVLYGEGLRWYIMVKYKMNDILLLSLRYGETVNILNAQNQYNQNDHWIGVQTDMTF
jgi:hypothetical protein